MFGRVQVTGTKQGLLAGALFSLGIVLFATQNPERENPMYAFANLGGSFSAREGLNWPGCDTTFGFEREVGINTYGDRPVNVYKEFGFSNKRSQIQVGQAGFLTTEAGPFNLEMVTAPVYTVEMAMSHQAELNAEVTRMLGPSWNLDLLEYDGRVAVPCSLADWVNDQRYQAMFAAFQVLTADRPDQANVLKQFLMMPLWRSTHISFGVHHDELKVRLADVLTMLAPYLYAHFQERFRLPRSRRVKVAYAWELGGYGPGYIIYRDWAGYAEATSCLRRLICKDEVTGLYQVDLETCYTPGDDITECHPWVRIRSNRVELRILPPFSDDQLVMVLCDLIPLINVLMDSLWGTVREMPEEGWAKAFEDIQGLRLNLPLSPPDQVEWEAQMSRL